MGSIPFWLIAGAMALASTGLMVAALGRGRTGSAEADDTDLRVYRDQLQEVERDLARGIIPQDEAARLRLEIGRRILTADQARAAAPAAVHGPAGLAGIVLIAGIVALVGFGTYGLRGHPGLDDQPMAARLQAAEARRAARPGQAEAEARQSAARPPVAAGDPRHAELITQLRQVMLERPNDLAGQELLARNEAMLGNFAAAARAQAMVVTLKGPVATAEDLAMQAELMITAAGGQVTPEAETVLAAALEKDGTNGLARYYSGLLFAQTGRPDLAFRFWAPLWETSSPGDPWAPALQQQLPDLAWLAGQHRYQMPALRNALRGPDQAAIDAAADMTPEERAAFVRSMVDGLMARLASEGGSADEWAQLIQALGRMDDHERARAILTEARERFRDHPADLARIEAAARDGGVAP